MNARCPITGHTFEIRPEDIRFLERVAPRIGNQTFSLPLPIICPDERMRRRMSFRNERTFYSRTCDATKKRIISIYSPDKPHHVVSQDHWWSDAWDGLAYGREFNFSQPFFPQFAALLLTVPRLALYTVNCENCEFNNYTRDSKNCYLSSCVSNNTEDAYYSYFLVQCKSVFDCLMVVRGELLYQCIDTYDSYHSFFLSFSQNCRDCFFGYGLTGCSDCIGCMNLRNKQYYVFNQPYSKTEYQRILAEIKLGSHQKLEELKNRFLAFKLTQPHRATINLNVENCIGENLRNARNCYQCFDGFDAEDLSYVNSFLMTKDSMDIYSCGSFPTELVYESCVVYGDSNVLFSSNIRNGRNILYSDSLVSCADCFGCVGLKQKQYCVFNRQYAKAEYETLSSKLINHMITSGEWGQFFPAKLSPFGYNETVAQDFMPLEKSEAIGLGYHWSDYQAPPPTVTSTLIAEALPDSITEIDNSILDSGIECVISKRPFRITKGELDFYRSENIPLPRLHPDGRHRLRMEQRNRRKLWQRPCGQSGRSILTSFAPERPEIVFSEEAYREIVF